MNSPRTRERSLARTPARPVYRLIYNLGDEGRLAIKFEIAPTPALGEFKVYVEGPAHKASG